MQFGDSLNHGTNSRMTMVMSGHDHFMINRTHRRTSVFQNFNTSFGHNSNFETDDYLDIIDSKLRDLQDQNENLMKTIT